jgi:putative ABC transport system permease protein
MSPPAPQRYRKVFSGVIEMPRMVKQSSVIIMRHLTHWPWRTLSGILGIAMAVAILVGSLWSFGSIDHMIDVTFRIRATGRTPRSPSLCAGPADLCALRDAGGFRASFARSHYRAGVVKLRKGHVERRSR